MVREGTYMLAYFGEAKFLTVACSTAVICLSEGL